MVIRTFEHLKEIATKANLRLEKDELVCKVIDDASDRIISTLCCTQEQVESVILKMGVEKLRRKKKKWVENTKLLLRENISGQAHNLPDDVVSFIVNKVINQCLMLRLSCILNEVVKKQTASI